MQASTYCLAVRLLSSAEGNKGFPSSAQEPLLGTVEWFDIKDSPRDLGSGDMHKFHTVLHPFANQAVGFFAVELRSALAKKRVAFQNISGLSPPPRAVGIPFASLMDLPIPLSHHALEAFCTCHLPTMATPDFFIEGEWTAYISHTGKTGKDCCTINNPIDWFYGFGGDNEEVRVNGWDSPNTYYPFVVERQCRFRLVNWVNDDVLFVQSNYVQSPKSIHMFHMIVDRRTGMIDIYDYNHRGGHSGKRNSAITPFGIVQGRFRGMWMWLWKVGTLGGVKDSPICSRRQRIPTGLAPLSNSA
jgi:hypothetical protein